MDDRTRTPQASEGQSIDEKARGLRFAKTTPPVVGATVNQSDPGILGLLVASLLAVLLGGLIVAGLIHSVGAPAAIVLATLAFGVLVWTLVPTRDSPPSPQPSPAGGEGAGSRGIRRGATIAGGVFLAAIAAVSMPGCGDSPAAIAAYEALDTNREILDPMTLRGIDDAQSSGDISPALASQYRGLLSDQNALIDALLGRPAEGAGGGVEPQTQNQNTPP